MATPPRLDWLGRSASQRALFDVRQIRLYSHRLPTRFAITVVARPGDCCWIQSSAVRASTWADQVRTLQAAAGKTRSKEELRTGLEGRCDGANSTCLMQDRVSDLHGGAAVLDFGGNDTISHFKMIVLSQILEPRPLKAGF